MHTPKEIQVSVSVFAFRRFCKPKAPAKTIDEVEQKQEEFVGGIHADQFPNKAWDMASATRNKNAPVYKHKEHDAVLRDSAMQDLRDFAAQYAEAEVSEAHHVDNIGALRDILTCKYREILYEGKFRFGCAQKLLNLYLKYQWCKGILKTPPPHCTFDDEIIDLGKQALGDVQTQLAPKEVVDNGSTWKWTESDDVNHYLLWVAGAKMAAENDGYRSVAEWELFNWKCRG